MKSGSNVAAVHRSMAARYLSQKIQKYRKWPLTPEWRRDYIRHTTRAAAPLAVETLALVNP
ncbi:hypothetical protein [Chelativorans oligotrophicus]|jgi:hypothetical protein|uniref:hypothetical protein n=1 Tax=Chelativorans oligotrophicus TaxID=449974 RepID=UPI000307F170|nr:hypothetical protein [Chelativorans oligotrophicus]